MQTINYIKDHGLEKLTSEFAIRVKEYDEGLLVLNYDQIESPKSHPIVMECRSLILDKDLNVVSRSFDRFFNLGECPETQKHIDMSKAVCFDKVDGSLIKIYNWKGVWYIATRGTAFAESNVNGFDLTFADLVYKALGVTKDNLQSALYNLNPNLTYIFEVTSMENRVVTRYSGYNLHYLASRCNKTFEYVDSSADLVGLNIQFPNKYSFDSTEACVETAKNLKELREGYVLYQDGRPVAKIKSPAYCAVHLLRGEGLNPKRIAELVLTGEQGEYLAYFPEDEEHVTPYVNTLNKIKADIENCWESNKHLETQKDFALAVKDFDYSAVLFYLRKNGGDVVKAFNDQNNTYRTKLLLEAHSKAQGV